MQQLKSVVKMQQTQNAQNAQTVTVVQTQHKHVKHSKHVSVLQAKQQNAANASKYTAAQHATAHAVALAVQQVYFSKRVYINLRAKYISVTVSNTTQVCSNLLTVAKQYNAKVIVTQTAIVLHLFS